MTGFERRESDIAEIISRSTLVGLPDAESLSAVGTLIDYAADKADLALNAKAMTWCQELESRSLSAAQRALLDYFCANAWAHRQQAMHVSGADVWSWDQDEVQEQIFLLRRALESPAFGELHIVQKCQILTNLANQLSTVGRFVEARELWGRALALKPSFWMARGNRARGLMYYGTALYDLGHRGVFGLAAHSELTQALTDLDRHPELGDSALRSHFADAASSIARGIDLEAIAAQFQPNAHSLGECLDEQRYRKWCLDETLFLNPLNDLGPQPIAARDVLSLPDFVAPIGEAPVLVGFFNQLKQEFVSARWLFFLGINSDAPHFSDRDVPLMNTLDYPVFGLANEEVKVAFRMSYSILDKIAYFLNRYMRLNVPERKVSFRTIWRDTGPGPIRSQFQASENWPFRGLYWLSKDLFETGFQDLIEPDARALHELRNHLEHKYVKVHGISVPVSVEDSKLNPFHDDFAYSISRDALESRTRRLLKLTRSALIYLSLGMHREEVRRAQVNQEARTAKMRLDVWDDEWKGRW